MSKLKFEDTQYAKSGKRGRPPKRSIFKNVDLASPKVMSSLEKTLSDWDRMENQVDWETIAKKQEDRLNAYIAENEELAKICIMRWEEIQHLKYLVTYLEKKNENSSV
jgi:hypothetical protein